MEGGSSTRSPPLKWDEGMYKFVYQKLINLRLRLKTHNMKYLKFLGVILFVNVCVSVSGQQPTNGWEKLNEVMTFQEMDCVKRTFKPIKVVFYDDKGNMLAWLLTQTLNKKK